MALVQSAMRSLPGNRPSEVNASHDTTAYADATSTRGSSLGSAVMDAMSEMVVRRRSVSCRSLEPRRSSMSGRSGSDIGDAYPAFCKSMGTLSRLNDAWSRAEREGLSLLQSAGHTAGRDSASGVPTVVASAGNSTGSELEAPTTDVSLPLKSWSLPLPKTTVCFPDGGVAGAGGGRGSPESDSSTSAAAVPFGFATPEDASVHLPLILLTKAEDSSAISPIEGVVADLMLLQRAASDFQDPMVTMRQLMMVSEPGDPEKVLHEMQQHPGQEHEEKMEEEEEEERDTVAWHEVTAKPFLDPVTGRCAFPNPSDDAAAPACLHPATHVSTGLPAPRHSHIHRHRKCATIIPNLRFRPLARPQSNQPACVHAGAQSC